MRSYLSSRSQCVYVEGCLSESLPVESGLSQGSLLGPLGWFIYLNELPEIVHTAHVNEAIYINIENEEPGIKYNKQCQPCGGIVCFADDSTYSVAAQCGDSLTDKVTSQYQIMAEFLTNSQLKLNNDKTHLLSMATDQKSRHKPEYSCISIHTETQDIVPSQDEKILGIKIN